MFFRTYLSDYILAQHIHILSINAQHKRGRKPSVITFSRTPRFSSFVLKYRQRGFSYENGASGGYVYAQIDTATLEATEWHYAQYELDETKIPAYKSNDTFYLSISEDQIVYKFKKK